MFGMPTWMLAGVGAVAAVLAFVLAMTATRKISLMIGLGGMLFASAMALPLEWGGEDVRQTIWLGLQGKRDYMYGLFGMLTLVLLIFQLKRLSAKRISAAAFVLLIMGLYIGLMRFYHDGISSGVLTVVLASVTLPGLLLVPAAVIDDEQDLPALLRVILVVNGMWLGMVALQFVADRSLVVFGNSFRFVGLMSNPQHAGTLLACLATTALWLSLNETNRLWKFVAISIFALDVVMILWTGSRTSLGMLVVGCTGVAFSRLGRVVLLLPVAGIFFAVALKLFGSGFSEASTVLDRIGGGGDTRTEAWSRMLDAALANPLFGAGVESAGSSENGWLYGFAAYGVGMLALSLLLTVIGLVQVIKAVRMRWSLPVGSQSPLDLSAALVAAYFGGAIFEGFFSARISPNLVFIMIFTGVLTRLLQINELRQDDRLELDENSESYYDDYAWYGADPSPQDTSDVPDESVAVIESPQSSQRPRASW